MPNTFKLISTVTVGAGGTTSIDFTSIPSTYTDLCVKISTRTNTTSAAQDYIKIRFNSATTNYSDCSLFGNGSSAGSTSNAIGDQTGIFWMITSSTAATSNTFGNAELYIPNYAGSSYKSVSINAVSENNSSTSYIFYAAGIWQSTSAITSISLIGQDGTINQNSTASLYGIKNS
jgi:hypothetical protein